MNILSFFSPKNFKVSPAKKRLFLLLLIATLTVLLFVGGPSVYTNRVIKEIWQSGHFILFFCFSLAILSITKERNLALKFRYLIVFIIALLFAFLTESLQLMVGRHFELIDLFNDTVGATAGIFLFHAHHSSKNLIKILSYCFVLILLLIGIRSLIFAVIDEIKIRTNHPVIAGFESPLELTRWESNQAELTISDSHVTEGKNSAKIRFEPARYPGITLLYFSGNWKNFDAIAMDISSENAKPVMLTFKAYDSLHWWTDYDYYDRFRRDMIIKPGTHRYVIDLQDIWLSPKDRAMNMQEIVSLSLFSHNLKAPIILYIDNIHLVSNNN